MDLFLEQLKSNEILNTTDYLSFASYLTQNDYDTDSLIEDVCDSKQGSFINNYCQNLVNNSKLFEKVKSIINTYKSSSIKNIQRYGLCNIKIL